MTEEWTLAFSRKLSATAAVASLVMAIAFPADRVGWAIFGVFWLVLYAVLRARTGKASSEASAGMPSTPSLPFAVNRRLSDYTPTLVRRTEGFALSCAQCGEDAITFRLDSDGVHGSQITLTAGSYGVPLWSGKTGQHIADLLAANNSRELVNYIESLNPGQWEVYCPACDRIYCQRHLAAQTVWSGSWPDGMRVTCPNGHSRRFD